MTASVAEALIGTWKLTRWERHLADGSSDHPFGARPIGLVVYDRSGYMTAQIMRSDDGRQPARSASQTARAIGRDYVAYYGPFELDEEKCLIVHHVEASVVASWVGGDQVRQYELSGDTLVLRPPAQEDGGQSILYWTRIG